jgi:hypothetical protein
MAQCKCFKLLILTSGNIVNCQLSAMLVDVIARLQLETPLGIPVKLRSEVIRTSPLPEMA